MRKRMRTKNALSSQKKTIMILYKGIWGPFPGVLPWKKKSMHCLIEWFYFFNDYDDWNKKTIIVRQEFIELTMDSWKENNTDNSQKIS